MKLLIRGGWICDPSQSLNSPHDLWVVDGYIQSILQPGGQPPAKPDLALDAGQFIVAPGFIDLHTHLRDPGELEKEDLESGTEAAVAGGFTSILCMPNTVPPLDHPGIISEVIEKSKRVAHCRVYPVGAMTKNLGGEKITDMRALQSAGAVAFSDDGRPVNDPQVMRKALLAAKELKSFVIEHCEDLETEEKSCSSESIDAHRALMLATELQARLHLAHVSCETTISLLREYKKKWPGITAEVTPHHLMLTEAAIKEKGTDAKMYPPLRSPEDMTAARAALKDGTIDVIATDHAPHTKVEKAWPFERAPNGIIGLETAFPLMMTLVEEEVITLEQLVQKMSSEPARIAGIPGGTLKPGTVADLVIFDSKITRTLTEKDLRSKSRNSPFLGAQVRGQVKYCLVGGEIKFGEPS